jgi:hypothetical protein
MGGAPSTKIDENLHPAVLALAATTAARAQSSPLCAPAAQLSVLGSAGFAAPYRQLLPIFERKSGLTVTSAEAASQGNGPDTMPALIRNGAVVDVVIMTREGLGEIAAAGSVMAGSTVELACGRPCAQSSLRLWACAASG